MTMITKKEDERQFLEWYDEAQWGMKLHRPHTTYEEYKEMFRCRQECGGMIVCETIDRF